MKLTAWGRYSIIDAQPLTPGNDLGSQVSSISPIIPLGNGRSYGDSALAATFVPMLSRNRLLAFDEKTGLLICESGVLLSEILDLFVPNGWFLKVTPGTKLITVGGAIASDVHGKKPPCRGVL